MQQILGARDMNASRAGTSKPGDQQGKQLHAVLGGASSAAAALPAAQDSSATQTPSTPAATQHLVTPAAARFEADDASSSREPTPSCSGEPSQQQQQHQQQAASSSAPLHTSRPNSSGSGVSQVGAGDVQRLVVAGAPGTSRAAVAGPWHKGCSA